MLERIINSSRFKAISYILIACALFTTVIALSRVVSATISVPTILFFQYFISMLVMLPWMIQRGGKNLYLSKIGVIVLRSLAGYLNYAFIFFAVQKIPLVNVILLNNTAPLFIPLIILMWKKVRISRRLWIGIIVGFVGIAVTLRPNHDFINIGSLFALGSAICVSISMIAQRRLVKSESVYTISFYYFLIGSIISLPFMLDRFTPPDPLTMVLLGTMGILFVAGQFFYLNAFKHEKPSYLSSFTYSAIVYGVLIEWFAWKQFPGWVSMMGIIIVCSGGLITIRQGRRKGISARTPKVVEEKKPEPPEIIPQEEDQSSN